MIYRCGHFVCIAICPHFNHKLHTKMTLECIKEKVLEVYPNATIVFHYNGVYYKNQKKSSYGYVVKDFYCNGFVEIGDYCKTELAAWKSAFSKLDKVAKTPHQKSDN